MKALMYRGVSPEGRGDFQLIDVPVPDCPPGSVELDVEWCGICGSDLHEFEADTMSTYATPVVIGHEFSGVVSRVGEGVDSVRVGQRVAVEPFLHCRECAACLAGDSHLCPSLAVVGAHHAGGGRKIDFMRLNLHSNHSGKKLPRVWPRAVARVTPAVQRRHAAT